MFVSQKERHLPMPDYNKSTATEVVLTLPGNVIDENYSLLLLENRNLSLTDAVLLDSARIQLASANLQNLFIKALSWS